MSKDAVPLDKAITVGSSAAKLPIRRPQMLLTRIDSPVEETTTLPLDKANAVNNHASVEALRIRECCLYLKVSEQQNIIGD
jgi:hypothetical protein